MGNALRKSPFGYIINFARALVSTETSLALNDEIVRSQYLWKAAISMGHFSCGTFNPVASRVNSWYIASAF